MTAKIILNPYSGRWKGREKRQEIEAALKVCGVEYDLVETAGPNHGTQLAAEAVRQGLSPIISAGGDGCISEVINGIMLAASDSQPLVPFGVLPLGSANDLVDNLGLPKELTAATRVIASGKTRFMDLCQVNGRYFDNNAAIGLEPYITLIQQRITSLRGSLRYLVATLKGILDNPHWTMRLEWEEGEFQGPITLVTVGNMPRTGGLFYVTPHASPFDGLLTFVYGYIPSRIQILGVLPRTMKRGPGSYVEHPAIHEINTTWLHVHTDQPTPLHADGEIQSNAIQDIEYRVLPGRLPILIP
jgi:diacylglycerol kinase (ATP)